MLTATLIKLFERDLKKLVDELEAYQTEAAIWSVASNISNSAGNLSLHLIGNLNAFVGTVLGNTGYVRQRELEFSTKDVPRTELVANIRATSAMVTNVLKTLAQQDLDADYPMVVFAEKMTTEFFLVHLATHLAYHLGQINYHRRLIDVANPSL